MSYGKYNAHEIIDIILVVRHVYCYENKDGQKGHITFNYTSAKRWAKTIVSPSKVSVALELLKSEATRARWRVRMSSY